MRKWTWIRKTWDNNNPRILFLFLSKHRAGGWMHPGARNFVVAACNTHAWGVVSYSPTLGAAFIWAAHRLFGERAMVASVVLGWMLWWWLYGYTRGRTVNTVGGNLFKCGFTVLSTCSLLVLYLYCTEYTVVSEYWVLPVYIYVCYYWAVLVQYICHTVLSTY